MKRLSILLTVMGFILVTPLAAQDFEAQGTTVKREADSCTVDIIMQIALDGATDAQFNAIKNDLTSCFNKVCPMPCATGNGRGCTIKASAVVKKWEDLTAADQRRFHHIKVVDHEGISNSHRGKANSGVSRGGTWYFPEENNAYCHEALHLAGLEDKYCDCTITEDATHTHKFREYGHRCNPPPDPHGGLCCLNDQDTGRHTYPCDSCGDDIMATLSANVRCINYVRILQAAGMSACPASCCEEHHNTIVETIEKTKLGVTVAAEIGAGIFKEKVTSGVIRNIGPAISFAAGVTRKIDDALSFAGALKFAYDRLSASKESSQRPAAGYTVDQSEHFAYKYAALYLDMYIYYHFMHQYVAMFGPQIGAFIVARQRYQATYTTNYNGYSFSQQYGSDHFTGITASKNVQVGINIGLGRDITIHGMTFTPYVLYRQPITNVISSGTRNALTQVTLGVQWPLK